MEEQVYRVIFSGKIHAGIAPEEVREKLANLFKLNPDDAGHRLKLKRLFSGRPIVIKQGLSHAKALAYVEALTSCGAIGTAEPVPIPPETGPGGIDRRIKQRRSGRERRAVKRASSILPDRRSGKGRRRSDLKPEQ